MANSMDSVPHTGLVMQSYGSFRGFRWPTGAAVQRAVVVGSPVFNRLAPAAE